MQKALTVFFVLCTLLPARLLAEPLSVGVLRLPDTYDEDTQEAQFIRDLIGRPLLSNLDDGLSPASVFSVEFLPSSLIMRWGHQSKFANGAGYLTEDIKFSFKRCEPQCSYQLVELSNGIRFHCSEPEKNSCCQRLLTACVIVQKEVSVRFEELFFSGTNLVTNGPYMIVSSIPGKKLQFVLRESLVGRNGGPESITMTVVDGKESGLKLLRRGKVGALLLPIDRQLESRVLKDDTLTHSTCKGVGVLHRREYSLPCSPFIGFEVPERNQAENIPYDTRTVEQNSARN